MKITITNSVKQVSEDQRIFKLHPGRYKVFLQQFLKEDKVWMELPGISLEELSFDEKGNFDKRSKQMLQRSRAIANYIQGRDQHKRPADNLDAYHPDLGLGKEFGPVDPQTFTAIQTLYFGANEGDLIVVPGRSFSGEVLVGELKRANIRSTTNVRGWGKMPARRIKWLQARKLRHDFSIEFAQQLTHPRALHLFPASLTEEVFDYAYGNWAYTNSSNLALEVLPLDKDANEVSPQALAALNLLVMYYGNVYDLLDEGGDIKTFSETITQILSSTSTEYSWEGAIHSPGSIVVRIKNQAKAGFILSMIGLTSLTTADAAEEIVQQPVVEVVNRWNNVPDECEIDVAQHILAALKHMNADIWIENCRAQQDLIDDQIEVVSDTTLNIDSGDDNGNDGN